MKTLQEYIGVDKSTRKLAEIFYVKIEFIRNDGTVDTIDSGLCFSTEASANDFVASYHVDTMVMSEVKEVKKTVSRKYIEIFV